MYRILYVVLFLLSFYGFLQLIKLVFNLFVPWSIMSDLVHICLAIVMGVPFSSFVAGRLTPMKVKK